MKRPYKILIVFFWFDYETSLETKCKIKLHNDVLNFFLRFLTSHNSPRYERFWLDQSGGDNRKGERYFFNKDSYKIKVDLSHLPHSL